MVPTNVEKYLMTHPAVEDVAVVGLPHDVDGERPLAFVVLSPKCHATADELITYISGNEIQYFLNKIFFIKLRFKSVELIEKVMDEEKLRGGIRFIDKIVRNDLGKIIRPELMKLL